MTAEYLTKEKQKQQQQKWGKKALYNSTVGMKFAFLKKRKREFSFYFSLIKSYFAHMTKNITTI